LVSTAIVAIVMVGAADVYLVKTCSLFLRNISCDRLLEMAHKILRHGLEIKICAAVTAATTIFCVGIGAQPSKASAFKYLGEGKSWNNTTLPIHANDIRIRGNYLLARKPKTKTWEEVYIEDDPDMAEWVINNPEEAAIMKEQWQYAESVKKRPFIDNSSDCAIVSRTWDSVEGRCETTEEQGYRIQNNISYPSASSPARTSSRSASSSGQSQSTSSRSYDSDGCPPGQQMYRYNGLFGIGARDIGCMTAYEAERLETQGQEAILRNMQQNQDRIDRQYERDMDRIDESMERFRDSNRTYRCDTDPDYFGGSTTTCRESPF
jgi:hypothetical protein